MPSVMHTTEVEAIIADPAPLGLVAFGMTTMLAMWVANGVVPAASGGVVLAMAAAFGGLGQVLAGMWAFRRGNTFAATAFTSYGLFWFSYYLINDVFAKSAVSPMMGLYFFMWAIFTAYMFVAALHGTRAVQAVFFLLALTFLLLAFGAWGNSSTWTHIAGWVGVLTAIAAMYTSFADVLNATAKRIILPTN